VAVASAGPHASLHLAPDRQPRQHPTTQCFTGRMPFLPPNQQRQSTEGIKWHYPHTPAARRSCWASCGHLPTVCLITNYRKCIKCAVNFTEVHWLIHHESQQICVDQRENDSGDVKSTESFSELRHENLAPSEDSISPILSMTISCFMVKKVKVACTRLPSVGFRS